MKFASDVSIALQLAWIDLASTPFIINRTWLKILVSTVVAIVIQLCAILPFLPLMWGE